MPIGLWGYQRSGLVTYKETIENTACNIPQYFLQIWLILAMSVTNQPLLIAQVVLTFDANQIVQLLLAPPKEQLMVNFWGVDIRV